MTSKPLPVTNMAKKGHTSRFYRVNTKLHELQLEEEVIHHIHSLLIEAFETKTNPSDTFEEPIKIDEITTSNSDLKDSSGHISRQINVLTRDQ